MDGVALAAQHGMRVEPFERGQVEPRGDRGALLGVGDEVEPVAVADPVERQAMGEIAHASTPLSNASSEAPDSPSSKRRSASPEKVAALSPAGGRVAIDAEADGVGPVAFAAAGMAPAVDPAGERADHRAHLLADRGIAEALLAHLAVHVGDEAFGQRDRAADRRFAAVLEPQDGERDEAGEHGEAPVERIGDRAFDIPGGAPRLRHQRGVERLDLVRGGPPAVEQRSHARLLSSLHGWAVKTPWLAPPPSPCILRASAHLTSRALPPGVDLNDQASSEI